MCQWTDPSVTAKRSANDSDLKYEETASSRAVVATKELSAKPAPAEAGTVPGGTKDAKAAAAKTPTSAASESKKAATPAALSATRTAVTGAHLLPVTSSAVPVHKSAAAPATRCSREIDGKEEVHGTTPDEHVTVEVKSKKKDWRGALDVGLKVLDSAMERAKKGGNLEKPTGHNAPVVKVPVTKEAAETASTETSKERSATPSKEPLAGAKHGTLASTSKETTPRTEEERPKAASKLSWKSPFKKHAAGPLSPEHELSRTVDDEDETKDSHTITEAKSMAVHRPAPALTPQPTSKSPPRGAADNYYNSSDNEHAEDAGNRRVQSGGTKSPGPQTSYVERGTAAAGAGAVGGAAVRAAGYSAYNDYERESVSGDGSSPPSPPSEESADDDSGLPSPPSEEDVSGLLAGHDSGNKSGPTTAQDNSAPPSPLLEADNNTSGPPTPPNESALSSSPEGSQAGETPDDTTYAFEQPSSPTLSQAKDDDSNPPTPSVQADSDDGEDQAAPSPDPVEDEDSNPPTPPIQDKSDDDENQAASSPLQSASPSPSTSPLRPASPAPPTSPAPAEDSDSD